jgi:hypothetical protein
MKLLIKPLAIILLITAYNCKETPSETIQQKEDQVHGLLEVSQDKSTQSELYYLLKEKDSIYV